MLTECGPLDEKELFGLSWLQGAVSQSVRAGGRKEGLTDFVPARLLGSQINRERERVRAEY